ncbi:MAG: hypothetical protein ACE37F_26740 [Nannocystaceae bacterium]|nr:hypothetical protein [bacterium]
MTGRPHTQPAQPAHLGGGGRLDELLCELGAEGESDAHAPAPMGGGDVFFTARVLDALPEPLRWTGASPLTRAATLLGFHVAAAVVGVMAYRWASPRIFDVAATRAAEAASPWASSLALVPVDDPVYPALAVVLVVGLVAFWATRSHTPAT